MNKTEFDNTKEALEKILSQSIESIKLEENNIPSIDMLQYNNTSYKIKCSILFIDIRQSTVLNDNTQPKNMIKIYKSFVRMATQCVRYAGGVTRQFIGDRIMGVFIDDYDENHNIIKKSSDKAIEASRNMGTYTDYLLNHLINKYINGKFIKCGIGICTGNILLAKVGMRGVESDNNKQNENGDIWVGKVTNYASKYADLTNASEVFIDENTYKELSEENKKYNTKEIWHRERKIKGNKIYSGYICKDLYINNIQELDVDKFEHTESVEIKNELIEELERKIVEYTLKKEKIEKLEKSIRLQKENLDNERKNLERDKNEKEYHMLKEMLSKTFLKEIVIGTEDYWKNIIKSIFELGEKLNYSKYEIEKEICLYLASIYYYMGLYDEAYNYIVMHTRLYDWYCDFLATNIVKKRKLRQSLLDVLREKQNNIENSKEKLKYKQEIEKLQNIVF